MLSAGVLPVPCAVFHRAGHAELQVLGCFGAEFLLDLEVSFKLYVTFL